MMTPVSLQQFKTQSTMHTVSTQTYNALCNWKDRVRFKRMRRAMQIAAVHIIVRSLYFMEDITKSTVQLF